MKKFAIVLAVVLAVASVAEAGYGGVGAAPFRGQRQFAADACYAGAPAALAAPQVFLAPAPVYVPRPVLRAPVYGYGVGAGVGFGVRPGFGLQFSAGGRRRGVQFGIGAGY